MKLTFKNNLEVSVESIEQRRTYSGWLMGLPTEESNEEMLDDLPEFAQQRYGNRKRAIHLIKPIQKAIESEGESERKPAMLPTITCIASLRSYYHVLDKDMDYSELILIWFQEEFAFPIDKEVLAKIKEIDWIKVAQDMEW